MSDNEEDNRDDDTWSEISSISSFDRGNDSLTRKRVENIRTESRVVFEGQAIDKVKKNMLMDASTSLLIEALVKIVCSVCEPDPERQTKLFGHICDAFFKSGLINFSYKYPELGASRGQYQLAIHHFFTVTKAAIGSAEIIKTPDISSFVREFSRYRNEYDEIGFIASGGFGSVYKALHKLDRNVYAIKKIVVRKAREKTILKHLEEVQMLAKFNHTNIVAYKGAWIEQSRPLTFDCHKYVTESNASTKVISSAKNKSSSNIIYRDSTNTSGSNLRNRKKSYETEIDDEEEEEDSSDIVSFRNDSPAAGECSEDFEDIEKIESTETDTSESNENNSGNRVVQYDPSRPKENYATLYIQMGLCEETLREWMDKRGEPTPPPILRQILTQILEGLYYIHSLGAVHHDIKPSNIFIDTSGSLRIQLGDFGLACPLQQESHLPMGTQVYAAPEQLQGLCDPKSDVYSLGIVLFELLFPMSTAMERSQLIMQLKAGKFLQEEHYQRYPDWCKLIKRLIRRDVKERPSTKGLLEELSHDKDIIIATLTDDNKEKDTKIKMLKNENNELKQKNEELSNALIKLKAELEQLKIQSKM